MRESANARNRRNPYLKLSYPNGVTLILPADIMDNLKDWKGVALMCDGYSGYDQLKKIPQFGIKQRLVACEDRYASSLPMPSDMGCI